MAKTGQLETDPLFLGLTRPPMFFGVTYTYTILNAGVTMISFINTTNVMFFILLFILHGVGYILCSKEPLCMELLKVRMEKCNFCKNRMYYGANSYDLF